MPLVSEEEAPSVPEHNPLIDTRDDVLGWIDRITRDVEAIKASKTSLTQVGSRLDEIRTSLPQLKTSLTGLRCLQRTLKKADYDLGRLGEPTANGKRPGERLLGTRLEEIALELDDGLYSALHDPELQHLARVEQSSDLGDVAQIFLPPPPPRNPIRHPRGPIREGSRSLSTEADDTESRRLHDALESSRATPSHGVAGSLNPFTVDELCDKIRSTPELASIPIDDLFRREMPTGFQHEFILIKSGTVSSSIWIRIDRAAKGYERGQVRTRYPANDTARMGGQEHHGQMIGKSRLRAHVVFPRQPDRPNLLTLATLIAAMRDESRYYRPLTENCYFFTSVIQEILTEHYGGKLVSGALGHKKLSRNVRGRIRQRLGIIGSRHAREHIPGLQPASNSHKSWKLVRLPKFFFKVAPCHANAGAETGGLGVNCS